MIEVTHKGFDWGKKSVIPLHPQGYAIFCSSAKMTIFK